LLSFDVRQIHKSAWLLSVLSAALQILIFPLPGVYVLCWFALVPLILAVLRARPAGELDVPGSLRLRPATLGQGFLIGWLCGIVFYAGTCYWIFDTMRLYGGLSSPMALLVLFLFCCYLGLYHAFFGLLLAAVSGGSRHYRRALISAPFLWVAVELARTRITGFPWNLLGIAQVENVSLSRISSWSGVYGLSFEIALVNVAFAAAILVPREKRSALLIAALAAAAVLQAGILVQPPPDAADHAALLVQQNIPVAANWTPASFQQTLSDLTALTVNDSAKDSASPNPSAGSEISLVVWPESPAPFFTHDPRFEQAVSEMAIQTQTWVVVGAIGASGNQSTRTNPQVYNSAALISPQGEWKGRYDKVHLVPFGEYLPFPSLFSFAGGLTQEVGEFEHGASRSPLNAGGSRLGIFICYESVFPDEVRQFANNGASVFVNISNDGWYGDSGAWAQHLNQTRMRAIENNRWILSATDTGLTASIDPWGRVVASLPRKQRAAMLAPYSLTSGTTFYTRHGDWFAFACAIISIAALISRFAMKSPES
jgi:apolipoprotein N-acyltransferase